MRDDDQPKHVCTPEEVVPAALRELLGWDFRHDAMARLIMDEFTLTLPRDRELIRQLAFIRVQQGEAHVMPFGKHKGRLLEEILIDDPSYLDWLAAQDWFRTEFPALHKVIVNFDAEDEADKLVERELPGGEILSCQLLGSRSRSARERRHEPRRQNPHHPRGL